MKTLVVDFLHSPLSARKVTDEGYLSVPARVARTGIQQYLASELGLTDRSPNAVVNVYRPPEEVFKDESLASYLHKEITDDHPPSMVSSDTYKQYSSGQVVSKGKRVGDWVEIETLIKDQAAIDAVNNGKAELSAGYLAEYVAEIGVTDDGEEYEFVQRNIVINHVALVDKARAGQGARIFDKKGDPQMKVITLDNGRTVQISDDASAALIEDAFARQSQAVVDAEKRVADAEKKAAQASKDAEEAKAKADNLEEELEKEKEKTSDSAIATVVNETLSVHDAARKMVTDFDCEGKSIDTIKREVCAALHPSRDFQDKDMTYINAVFDMDKEKMEEDEDNEEESKKKAADSLSGLADDLDPKNVKDAQAARESARQDFLDKRFNIKKEA